MAGERYEPPSRLEPLLLVVKKRKCCNCLGELNRGDMVAIVKRWNGKYRIGDWLMCQGCYGTYAELVQLGMKVRIGRARNCVECSGIEVSNIT
ncbi:MAG TPA: hypothetical protein VIY48_07855 [Candidatus Paceibacterota bacterium]